MEHIFKDIQSELELFFTDLNWTYIFMYVIIIYGINHKSEFNWYNKLAKKYFEDFKLWISGLLLCLLFIIFRLIGPNSFDSEYIAQVLRSWMIVVVFNSFFSKKIKEVDK